MTNAWSFLYDAVCDFIKIDVESEWRIIMFKFIQIEFHEVIFVIENG